MFRNDRTALGAARLQPRGQNAGGEGVGASRDAAHLLRLLARLAEKLPQEEDHAIGVDGSRVLVVRQQRLGRAPKIKKKKANLYLSNYALLWQRAGRPRAGIGETIGISKLR